MEPSTALLRRFISSAIMLRSRWYCTTEMTSTSTAAKTTIPTRVIQAESSFFMPFFYRTVKLSFVFDNSKR